MIKENNLQKARSLCLESLRSNKALGHETGVIASLVCLASILFAENNVASAHSLVASLLHEINASSIKLMEPDEKELSMLCMEMKVDLQNEKYNKISITQKLQEIGIY